MTQLQKDVLVVILKSQVEVEIAKSIFWKDQWAICVGSANKEKATSYFDQHSECEIVIREIKRQILILEKP